MLAKRIIPCLDVKEGRVVKGIKFLGLRDAGDPAEIAKIYDEAGADELVFLDITASFEQRKILLGLVERTAKNIFMPFTVGGGVRDIQDIRDLLNAGAEKVSINTAAVKYPGLISEAAAHFGCQCIVVAIDAKLVHSQEFMVNSKKLRTKKWQVYINGGRTPTELEAVEWAAQAAELGAGEILLTSMDFDGTKDGYDICLTRCVSEAVHIPVIASGGAGNPEHFYDVLANGKAEAALAASIFHYAEFSIREIKEYLFKRGIAVRL
jgi:cyclase